MLHPDLQKALKFEKFNFRHESGLSNIDVVSYARDMVCKHSDIEVYVGCDSQSTRKHIVYATVIAFRFGTRGVHFIYHKHSFDKRKKLIKDRWTRLWMEANYTSVVAKHLQDNMVPVHYVELDYNQDPCAGSHTLLKSGIGFLLGLGFREKQVLTKPNVQVAVKAANHLVN